MSHFTADKTFTVIDPKTGDPVTLTDTRSFLDHVSDAVFSGTTMAGVVSVGADYVLDKVGAPDWTRDLTQGFISGFASSETGQKFFNWLGQGARNFAGWVWDAGSAVVDFGAKMLEGAAEMTEAGFRKAIDFFAPAFNQQTQDELYREVKYGLKGTVTVDGDVWTWQGESTTITFNTKTGEATNTAGGSTMDIEGLGRGTNGEYGYKELNYKNVTEDGTYQRTYQNGKLVGYEYCTNSGMCVTARADEAGSLQDDGTMLEGNVSVYIPGPDPEPNPNPDPTDLPNWYDSYRITFDIHNGQATEAHTEYHPGTGSQTSSSEQNDKNLYVLTNGFMNPEVASAPEYLVNMREDIARQSDQQVSIQDIILAPTFYASAILEQWKVVENILNIAALFNPGAALGSLVTKQMLSEAMDRLLYLVRGSGMWVSEMIDPATYMQAGSNISTALEDYFRDHRSDQGREIVGVGYSGGFLPLGEVLGKNAYAEETQTGYNAIALVGLGGVNVQLDGPYKKALDEMVLIGEMLVKAGTATAEFLSNIQAELAKLVGLDARQGGWTQSEADQVYHELARGAMEAAYQLFIQFTREKTQLWNKFEPSLSADAKLSVVVNVYGTKDFVTDWGLGGYRDSIGAYTLSDRNHQLVNIEIEGADHFDYIRSENQASWWLSGPNALADLFPNEEKEWNKTVSDFTAALISHCQSGDEVDKFMNGLAITKYNAKTEFINGRWVVQLPGWDKRN